MKDELSKALMAEITSLQHLRDWVNTYLDIDLPCGFVDPSSNSSPAEWLWEAYSTYKNNKGNEIPGYIILSSREGFKTLTESIFAVLMMVHFKASIAHMAAIENQAKKAITYIDSFLLKIKPYLEANGHKIDSNNKRSISILNDKGEKAYVSVVICSLSGANSDHTNIMCLDEIDVVADERAYREAKYIPGFINGQFPLTIKTSTRKFAFGLMQQEIDNAELAKEKILQWNIIDVTERCPKDRYKPKEPKQVRYLHPNLPLRHLSKEQFDLLPDIEKTPYIEKELYAGCASCPLAPVCQGRLAERPETDVGGLYKSIDFTINQFYKTDPDMSEAQLMCWRPSSSGLVYPNYLENGNKTNLYTVKEAYRIFTGTEPSNNLSFEDLVETLKYNQISFFAGVDWGYKHAFAITVSAKIPNGEWWLLDCYSVPGLEFEQMIALAEDVRDSYNIEKWYADTSAPMFIRAFRKRGMPCIDFKKDVQGGVESVRAQLLDASNNRWLKVIDHQRNEYLRECLKKHSFKLDQSGEPTKEPSDDQYADVCDTIRYKAQNLFPINKNKGKQKLRRLENFTVPKQEMDKNYQDWMSLKIQELAKDPISSKGSSNNKSFFWDFTGAADDEN
jgi:hypothetical protein